MREVVLTVGPRACGKSGFCERVIILEPTITLISRDKLLIELFGSTSLDPYTGRHYYALEQMWGRVKETLGGTSELRMILDTWNGSFEERSCIIGKLRNLGADRIRAWYFVTPAEYVNEWFWKKPGIAKMDEMRNRQGQGLVFYSEDAPGRDYKLFHRLASDIDSNGFDEVIRVNPLATRPEHVLDLQTSLEL